MHQLKISLVFLCLSAASLGMAQQAPFDPHQFIEWNQFYKLNWENFRGKPADNSIGDAGTAVKIIAKPYFVGNKIAYNVYALFDRNKSWATDTGDALLAHEQLHFDIAELYARKIRKKVSTMAKNNEKDLSRYNKAVKIILEESNEIDRRYDLETLHGSLTAKQKIWEEKIAKEMDELSAYQKKKVVIGKN